VGGAVGVGPAAGAGVLASKLAAPTVASPMNSRTARLCVFTMKPFSLR
jgi:hypothetical protein